jgi:hypothetical protein
MVAGSPQTYDPAARYSYVTYDSLGSDATLELDFTFGFLEHTHIFVYDIDSAGTETLLTTFEIESPGISVGVPGYVGGTIRLTNPGSTHTIRIQRRTLPQSPSQVSAGGPFSSADANYARYWLMYCMQETFDAVRDCLGKGPNGKWYAEDLEVTDASAALSNNSLVTYAQLQSALGGGGFVLETGPRKMTITGDGSTVTYDIDDGSVEGTGLDVEAVEVNVSGVMLLREDYTINDSVTPNTITFAEAIPSGVKADVIWIPGTIVVSSIPADSISTAMIQDGAVTLAKLAAEVATTFYSAANFPADCVGSTQIADLAVTASHLDATVAALFNAKAEPHDDQPTITVYTSGRVIGTTYTQSDSAKRDVEVSFYQNSAASNQELALQTRVDSGSPWVTVDTWLGPGGISAKAMGKLHAWVRAGYQYRVTMTSGSASNITVTTWKETAFVV